MKETGSGCALLIVAFVFMLIAGTGGPEGLINIFRRIFS
jgi:hypothetical protein